MRHTLLFVLLFLCGEARAVLLDWSTVTWNNGDLTNSYELDATNPGADITVTVSGDTARLTSGMPRVDTAITGGISPADKNLRSNVDFANTTQQLTFTITFNYPSLVTNATFTLFNIGNSGTNFQDQIRGIIATDGTNQYAATISGLGSSVQLAGSGTGQTLTGIAATSNSSSTGNATISFGSNQINQITYVYGNGPSTIADPKPQQIALFDISFVSAVPEVGASLGALAVCLFVLLTERRRRPAQ